MNDWTEDKLKLLDEIFEKVSMRDLLKRFPNRNKQSIFFNAKKRGLSRAHFKTSNNGYSMLYALCYKHGTMLKTDVYWKNGVPCCPRCGQRVRWTPRSSKYKVKQ